MQTSVESVTCNLDKSVNSTSLVLFRLQLDTNSRQYHLFPLPRCLDHCKMFGTNCKYVCRQISYQKLYHIPEQQSLYCCRITFVLK